MKGHGWLDSQEVAIVMGLTEKLRIHQQQQQQQQQQQHQAYKPIQPAGIGGLSRIPEGDTEMSNIATLMIVKDEAMMTG